MKRGVKMPVLKMTEDKELVITKLGNTYQNENNVETLKFILPKSLSGQDLKDCCIYLCFVNPQSGGDMYDITTCLSEYSDIHYAIEIPMQQVFTCESGMVKIWLKILNSSTNMSAKTNEVDYMIKQDRKIEDTMSVEKMSVLNTLIVKLDEAVSKIEKVNDVVEDIISGEQQIAQGGTSDGMDIVEI